MNLLMGVCSDKGQRAQNEDFTVMDQQLGLYVVADGTGGRAGGNTAARIACETIHQTIAARKAELRQLDENGMRQLLASAVTTANERIVAGQADPNLHGMATTVAVILHLGASVLLAHVGDSRIYLLRQRELRQLTRDHSLANFLADNPQIKPTVKRPGKTLVRALGLKAKAPEFEVQTVRLFADDVLLMCSDGITDVLGETVLAEILAGAPVTTTTEVAQCLVRSSLTHNTMDNTTAAVLHACPDTASTLVFESSDERPFGWLAFLEGPRQGTVLPLDRSTIVGADAKCELHIDDGFASSQHAEIFVGENGYAVRDLGSTNGTFVNDVKISHQPLVDGDIVRIGKAPMVFKDYRFKPTPG